MPDHQLAIDIDGLGFGRGVRQGDFQLSIPCWQVPSGRATALIGPSGCGKTTLLHLLAGMLTAQQGRLTVAGHCLHGAQVMSDDQRRSFRRRQVGLVFQEARLVPHLTVRDNILILHHRRVVSRLPATVIKRCTMLAERVGIAHLLSRRADNLSRGEAQRAALARAVMHRPSMILADEPTANLDSGSAQLVIDLLAELRQEQPATLIVASHDPRCLAFCSDHCDLPSLIRPKITTVTQTS